MPNKYAYLILVLIFLTLSCESKTKFQIKPKDPVPEFPYTAPPERAAKIISGYIKVKLGMTRNQVKEIMGKPDSAYVISSKELNAPIRGYGFKYYLYRDTSSVNSFKDDVAYITFDTLWKVKEITPHTKKKKKRKKAKR